MHQPTKMGDPWVIFDYEANMFLELWKVLQNGRQGLSIPILAIQNAVVESILLHIRQLADMILSRGKRPDDILLAHLVQDYVPRRLDELDRVYGNNNIEDCPCWTINKMLAHATFKRSSSHNYSNLVNQIAPILAEIVQEIRSVKPSVDSGETSTHAPTL